ncbi:hypothetical protein [Methanoregula sp.]|uniref:hypothetical protein n=1 Tax=Methanoregula sp. TaxID=2052170 RepID=UPI003FD7ACE9
MTSATEKSIKELYPLVMDEFDRDPAKAPQTASAIPKPAAVPQPTNPVTITKEKASIARHEPQVNSEPDALTEYLSSLTQERQREIKKYSNLPESDLEIPTGERAAAILATFCKKYATVPKGQRNTSLFLYSCTLRRCGFNEDMILTNLWQFSREHCKPPHNPNNRDDVAEIAQLSRRAARHVRPGFPAEKKVKAKGEHTTVANVSNPAPAAIDLDPCGIDPGNITGEEIKDLMLKGFQANSADIGSNDSSLICLLSYIGGRELTGDGLHLKVSGESQGGKSITIGAGLNCLPPEDIYAGACTPKAPIYDSSLQSGIIIKIDESQKLEPEFLALMKESVSTFQTPVLYRTVIDKKTVVKQIPPRITWVFVSVDSIGDEQVLNRLFPLGVDSKEKYQNVTDFRLKRREDGISKNAVTDDVLRIRAALRHYRDNRFRVLVPFASRIRYKSQVKRDQRLQEFFENCLIYHAALCYRERTHDTGSDGVITVEATEDDFYAVLKLRIFNRPTEATNRLSPSEIQLIKDIVAKGLNGTTYPIPRQDLLKVGAGYSQARLTNILRGRNGEDNGLLSKIPGFTEVQASTANRDDLCRFTERAYIIPAEISDLVPSNEDIDDQCQSIACLIPHT